MTEHDWQGLCEEFLKAQRQVERARDGDGDLQTAYRRRNQAIGAMKKAYYKSQGVESGKANNAPKEVLL